MKANAGPRTTMVGDLELRDATLDDAAIVADIDTELFPDDAEDPVLLRHWWTMTMEGEVRERRIVSLANAPVGYTMFRHLPWEKMPERYARVSADLRPTVRTRDRVEPLYAMLEDRARADGARRATSNAWEHDGLRVELLGARGYREERRERFWELDLVKEGGRITTMAAESRERMKREGIRIVTLAEESDPRRWEKLKRMSDEAEADVPTTVPHVPLDMADWMKWFESPALRPDRIWLAREGGDIVGISQLAYPPVRGVVSTDWTGTARKVRGRGVARALKCETLVQAIALGIDRVRTDNDSRNTPILHINQTMGYLRRPDMIQFLKEL
jgi:GNAT superfamily N-acetyltransferase